MKSVKINKIKKTLQGKGFLIALLLSVSAVGISTFLAYNTAISKIGDFGEDLGNQEIIGFTPGAEEDGRAVGIAQEGIPKDKGAAYVEDDESLEVIEDSDADSEGAGNNIADEASEEVNNFITPAAPRVMPVEGEVAVPYSNGELVKSKTLGVWKTHDGIDIAAPEGTPVIAATNGTVYEVYNDALWGICVTIDHGDGVLGCYYGLNASVPVAAGQEINAGDVIGSTGNTAEIEIAEEPHLHFAVKKNGLWTDPLAYINE